MSNFKKQYDPSSDDFLLRNIKTFHGSAILDHAYGPLYPIPQSIKSLQISVFQSGINNLSNRTFRSAGDISIWFDEFLAQAFLINIYISTSSSPFQMKSVDDNIEYTSPKSIGEPSSSSHFLMLKVLHMLQKNFEVVSYITKYVGESIKCLIFPYYPQKRSRHYRFNFEGSWPITVWRITQFVPVFNPSVPPLSPLLKVQF